MSDLQSLLARVEAAMGPDRELDCDIAVSLGLVERLVGKYRTAYRRHDLDGSVTGDEDVMVRRFTASVDACLALAERVLPAGWEHALYSEDGRTTFKALLWLGENKQVSAYAKTLPLALCAAILRARLALNLQAEADARRGG